jgi:tetratricopeptide (TPR) repeat protein
LTVLKKLVIPFFIVILSACQTVPEDIATEYYNIANAYFDVEDYEQAIIYYNKALNDDHPQINKIKYNLSIAYMESARVSEALGLIDALLEQDPDNLQVLHSRAYGHYLLGDDEKAVDVYNRILQIFEYDSQALLNKARLLKDTEPDSSIILLEKLNSLEPSTEIAILLGSLYKQQDRKDDFLYVYEEAFSRDKESSSLILGLAGYFEEERLFYKAIEYFDKLVALNYEDKKEVLFRKASIQLSELDEIQSGFDSLVESLDAGFNDRERIRELSENPELQENLQVQEYLKLRGLI